MKEFEEFAGTRICMSCYDKKQESINMIGTEAAIKLEHYGQMYVLNKTLGAKPLQMKVVKKWSNE